MWQELRAQAGEQVFLLLALHLAVLTTANNLVHRIQPVAINKQQSRFCRAVKQQELTKYRKGIPALAGNAKDR